MANTKTARPSTEPASDGPGRLLAGERAHYELAAGRPQAAEDLLRVMELSTEGGRLIPEQVWDAAGYSRRSNCSAESPRFGVSAGVGTLRVRQAAAIIA